jgi:asparagine synthetase B (glutamine-hydrolysing)
VGFGPRKTDVSVCIDVMILSTLLIDNLGLGHVRLSIIDPLHGAQPMSTSGSSEDDIIHCVVNGELYDYARIRAECEARGASFKTKSDSELVLGLWVSSSFFDVIDT